MSRFEWIFYTIIVYILYPILWVWDKLTTRNEKKTAMTPKPWWASKLIWLSIIEGFYGIWDMVADGKVSMEDWNGILLLVGATLTVIFRAWTDRPLAPRLLPKFITGK